MKKAKEEHHFACALSTIAAAMHNDMSNKLTTILITQAAAASSLGCATSKRSGRYRRGGAIPPPKESVWGRLEDEVQCNEIEFFMFAGLSQESFNLLVSICESTINRTPMRRDSGPPDANARKKRLFGPRGVMGMTVKFLTSAVEQKDVYAQFGATKDVFRLGVEVRMVAIINNMNHPKMRVFWDRSIEALEKHAERTSMFKDITGVVGIIDGRKMLSL